MSYILFLPLFFNYPVLDHKKLKNFRESSNHPQNYKYPDNLYYILIYHPSFNVICCKSKNNIIEYDLF